MRLTHSGPKTSHRFGFLYPLTQTHTLSHIHVREGRRIREDQSAASFTPSSRLSLPPYRCVYHIQRTRPHPLQYEALLKLTHGAESLASCGQLGHAFHWADSSADHTPFVKSTYPDDRCEAWFSFKRLRNHTAPFGAHS